MRELRSSKLAPGKKKIYTAGEKEYISEIERRETGIPLNKSLQQDIKVMQRELKLDNYTFPF
jgi:LDH2 family malate/lactate/ureidoglycolate dehydrogenase